MKILLIHQAYFPEMTGTAKRTKELAESFVKKGHTVNVLSSTPRKFRSFPDFNYKLHEKINNVRVYRVKTLFEVKKIVLFRMLSYLSFVIQSLNLAIKLSKQTDIIISVAPLSSGIIGSLVKLITKKHHHFDIPDILPDLGIAAGMIKNKSLIYLLRKIELWVYNHSNTISTCTEGQKRNIHQKGVPLKKLYFISDWIDTKYFKVNLDKYFNKVLNSFSLQNEKVISFVGNIGALQNPTVFIDLMKLMKEKKYNDFVLFFIGDGIMLKEIKERAIKYELDNVKFLGRIKREYIPAMMNLSDILVTNYVPDKHLELYIPGKLFEYAISRKPIVIGANGDAKKFIEKYNLGIAVNPSNIEEFMEAVIKIVNGSFKYEPKTNDFINDYSLDNISLKYDKIFENHIGV